MDSVPGSDVPVAILQKQISSSKSPEEKARLENKLSELMLARELIRGSMLQVVKKATYSPEQAKRVQKPDTTGHMCKAYKEVVEYYRVMCYNWHEPKYKSALQHFHMLANLCEENIPVERIKSAIDECKGKKDGRSRP
ncbi:legumain-like isoform X2 [Xyrauchen texanus]|nr:legumain-like isoform X2 [Xyrauchen texanus]XP_051956599.1 legumain-like isoform X2 [Xyrauchen texanus]XP_051956600.1 legumain-like isoform X2 [Xyrauchen texanus]